MRNLNIKFLTPNVHIKAFCDKVKKLDNFIIVAEREVPEMEEYLGIEHTVKPKKKPKKK